MGYEVREVDRLWWEGGVEAGDGQALVVIEYGEQKKFERTKSEKN